MTGNTHTALPFTSVTKANTRAHQLSEALTIETQVHEILDRLKSSDLHVQANEGLLPRKFVIKVVNDSTWILNQPICLNLQMFHFTVMLFLVKA